MRRVDVIINCYVGKGLGLTKGWGFSLITRLSSSYVTLLCFLRVLLFIVTFLLDFFLRDVNGVEARERRGKLRAMLGIC